MGMSVEMVRAWNVRALADRAGGVTKFAERIERSQSQVSQLVSPSPSKRIDRRLASHIEGCFDLPEYWLDQVHLEEWLKIQRASWADLLRRDLYEAGITIGDVTADPDRDPQLADLVSFYQMLAGRDRRRLVEFARVLADPNIEPDP